MAIRDFEVNRTISLQESMIPASVPTDHEPTMILAVGEMLAGIYEVRALIGEGGMGQVYDAYDHALARPVAIKAAWPTASPDNPKLRDEARMLAALRHSSMIAVHTLGIHRNIDYVVMERIYGIGLDKHLEQLRSHDERMRIEDGMEIFMALAEGLSVVHRAGLVHRDVKPANVMLAPNKRIVLLDFGLAHIESLNHHNEISGTVDYMAPETIAGSITPGQLFAVDLYALGVLAFEMIAGRLPYMATRFHDVLRSHLELDALRLADVRPETPPRLAALIQSMLAKDPHDRPSNMDEVLYQLRTMKPSLTRTVPAMDETFCVLIVEDEPDIARMMKLIVQKAAPDARVSIVTDGEEAIAEAHRIRPHLMLLDLNLPRMNGIEVCMHLRGTPIADRCAIVSVSAAAQAPDRVLLSQLGVTKFVQKGDRLMASLLPLVKAYQPKK